MMITEYIFFVEVKGCLYFLITKNKLHNTEKHDTYSKVLDFIAICKYNIENF